MKALLARVTPTILVGFTVLVLALLAAFHVDLSAAEQAATVAFVGAGAIVLLKYRTAASITALATAGLAVAVAFGLPVTNAQEQSILALLGGALALVLGTGAHQAIVARKAKGKVLEVKITADTTELHAAIDAAEARRTGRRRDGRLPAFFPPALKTFLEYATTTLKAPASWKVPAGAYPIDGNNRYGDCTIAGVAHLIAAFCRLFKVADHIPAEAEVNATYFKLGHGKDNGLVESSVLAVWRKIGLFGHKIWGYAPIKVTDRNAIKLAVAYYGGAYLGIKCPESAQRQFAEGKPWTDEGEETEDGHCVVALGYTKNGLLCATWGGIALLTWGFLAANLEEAWVILSHELVAAGKDTLGLNVPELEKDMASV